MNWPTKVMPAVSCGLFLLTRLRFGSVISSTGPPSGPKRSSCASSMPPGAARSSSACRRPGVLSANGGRSSKIRPNIADGVAEAVPPIGQPWLSAADAGGPPETAARPAPAAPAAPA